MMSDVKISPWVANTTRLLRLTSTPKTVLEIRAWKFAPVKVRLIKVWAFADLAFIPLRSCCVTAGPVRTFRQTAHEWAKIDWNQNEARPVVAWQDGPEVIFEEEEHTLYVEKFGPNHSLWAPDDAKEWIIVPPLCHLAIVAHSEEPCWLQARIGGQ